MSSGPRRLAALGVLVLGIGGLTGCQHRVVAGVPAVSAASRSTGATPSGPTALASTATSPSTSASASATPSTPATSGPDDPSSASSAACTSTGTTIPAGHYAGPVQATIKTTLNLNLPDVTVPDAGSGTEAMHGSVSIDSDGSTVTGSIELTGLGLSQVGLSSGPEVHSVDNGELAGRISGPADQPIVTATLSGEWTSLDAPLGQTSGQATNTVTVGLHVTGVGCDAVTGDAIAMVAQIAAPVAQYISIGGSGRWTATRS